MEPLIAINKIIFIILVNETKLKTRSTMSATNQCQDHPTGQSRVHCNGNIHQLRLIMKNDIVIEYHNNIEY